MWRSSEEEECRDTDEAADERAPARNLDETSEAAPACSFTEHTTEPGDAAVNSDIQCVEIDQYEVRSGCVRTLMMQTGAYADSKRFDVIEQTATPDGFEFVSTVFSDIQQAIDHLRDATKPKRKYSEVEPDNADCEPRVCFKRCSIFYRAHSTNNTMLRCLKHQTPPHTSGLCFGLPLLAQFSAEQVGPRRDTPWKTRPPHRVTILPTPHTH